MATENAAISVASTASSTARTTSPPQSTWKPNPAPIATTTASKTNIIVSPDRIGPKRMAKRLAGVTRSRSRSPDCSSKIVLKPMLDPLANASSERIPGKKTWRAVPVGKPAMPTTCLSSGVNNTR